MKHWKYWKLSKYFEKSENRVIFRKNIRIFFGRKFENLKKKISKSQNLKKVENFQNFEKISESEKCRYIYIFFGMKIFWDFFFCQDFFFFPSRKIFLVKILRKNYFDDSLVYKLDFCVNPLVYKVALRSHCSYYW